MKQIQALATSPNDTRYEQKTQVLVAQVFQVTLSTMFKKPATNFAGVSAETCEILGRFDCVCGKFS